MYLYCIPLLFVRLIRFIGVCSGQIYCSVYAIPKPGDRHEMEWLKGLKIRLEETYRAVARAAEKGRGGTVAWGMRPDAPIHPNPISSLVHFSIGAAPAKFCWKPDSTGLYTLRRTCLDEISWLRKWL